MEEKNRILAYIDWYESDKGYGIAKHNNLMLFFHKSYITDNKINVKNNTIISCLPILKNNIYHATDIKEAIVKGN